MLRTTARAILLGVLLAISGCATVGQFLAVERVAFALENISEVRLAGVDIGRMRTLSDVSLVDGAIIADATRRGDLQFEIEVTVAATNPPGNSDARIMQMDWTLILEGRETVSGVITDEIVIPKGGEMTFPVVARLNLSEFFEGSARDLLDIAASYAGLGGESKEVVLQVLPVVETAFGPITYSQPLRIATTRVGRDGTGREPLPAGAQDH